MPIGTVCPNKYLCFSRIKIHNVVNMYDLSQPTTLSTIDTGLLIVVRLKQNKFFFI